MSSAVQRAQRHAPGNAGNWGEAQGMGPDRATCQSHRRPCKVTQCMPKRGLFKNSVVSIMSKQEKMNLTHTPSSTQNSILGELYFQMLTVKQ